MPSDRTAALSLAAFLTGAGITHAAAPGFYDPMVPNALPGPARAWTYVSGVAEVTVGLAVAAPQTRRRGALAAAGLFVAVFPANVSMARDARSGPRLMRVGTLLRLPLQVPLVVWALRVARRAG